MNGKKLSQQTGFINVVLPKFEELGYPKDISDLYNSLQDKDRFKDIMINLFN